MDLNLVARMNAQGKFGKGDYTQFMQLLGYSVSGYGQLSTSPKELVAETDEITDQIIKSGVRRIKDGLEL